MKQTYARLLMLVAVAVAGIFVVVSPTQLYADNTTSSFNCTVLPQDLCDNAASSGTDNTVGSTGIFKLLNWGIQILTAIIGIAAVGAFVYAGILYSSAGGSSDKVAQSKKIMTDTAIGILVYALIYFATEWLIPGGVF